MPYEVDETKLEDKTTTTTTTTEKAMQEFAHDSDGDNKGSQLIDKKEQPVTLSPVAASKAKATLQTCLFEDDEKLSASTGDDTPAEAGAIQEEHMDTGGSSESPAKQVTVSGEVAILILNTD